MYLAQIKITLKKTVADPQGLTVRHALEALGIGNVDDVRMGKFIEIKIKAKDQAQAQEQVELACKKLLANPIIEDYSFELVPSAVEGVKAL